MKDIVIIGAGGHAKVIADIILKRKELLNEKINIVGFLDDGYKNLKYNKIFDIPILGDTSLIENLEKNKKYNYIMGIGSNEVRKKIYSKFPTLNYYTAIHPTAVIGLDVSIGKGTVVMSNVVVNSGTRIGDHCILNTGSIVEHDNTVGNYSHLSPNSILCGTITIGENSWIGAGSIVIQNKKIGKDSIIGAGSVIIKDIPNNCTVVGNPGRIIKGEYKSV